MEDKPGDVRAPMQNALCVAVKKENMENALSVYFICRFISNKCHVAEPRVSGVENLSRFEGTETSRRRCVKRSYDDSVLCANRDAHTAAIIVGAGKIAFAFFSVEHI